jgi:hypothetical protein
MSKFNSLMESNLNKTNLLRIRIKHDPANGIGEMNDYVGYVLEEDGMGNVVAIVPQMGGDTMSFGPGQYTRDDVPCGDDEQQADPLSTFKKHIVKHLIERGYHDKVKNHMDEIINAKDVSQLENLLHGCGCNGVAVLNMYRDFVSDATV